MAVGLDDAWLVEMDRGMEDTAYSRLLYVGKEQMDSRTLSLLRSWARRLVANAKRSLGKRIRRLVAAAMSERFDDIVGRMEAESALFAEWRSLVTELTKRIVTLQAGLERSHLDIDALRQQIEECLDFLRIQHEVSRDTLSQSKANAAALEDLRSRLNV